MFRSLRFRLPALFLAGIVLSGLVATLVAVRLFQTYTQDQSFRELRREALGIARQYELQAIAANDPESRTSPRLTTSALEAATNDRLYYAGASAFPGVTTGLRELSTKSVPRYSAVEAGQSVSFEFTPPDAEGTFLAVANPLKIGDSVFGALVVATPKQELRAELLTLTRRLALAFVGGIIVAMGLAWYFSRRVVRPLLALSQAADEVARGRYQVDVPEVPGGGEVGHLSDRFREMAWRLREANELERNFVMTISHELRTPLTAIHGHVSALREGIAADAETREFSLAAIASETARLERLVGDLLDLAKLEARRFAVRREEVDMERLLERAFGAFDQEAQRRGITYERRIEDRPTIVSDGDRVLQIVTNLLSNAFRWTPDGGRVGLELAAENGSVSVAVADTGPGIAPEERERIFRPFWTRDGRGTGLGLAISRELAHALGGRLELESEPGKGSRFELLLPAQP
ncbi:MAG: HAMP domain-containing histidine kinase [Actinobacteria bacterium]|nr:HAMP domain-containing histidine kinase [Actinomycetota bacterium]